MQWKSAMKIMNETIVKNDENNEKYVNNENQQWKSANSENKEKDVNHENQRLVWHKATTVELSVSFVLATCSLLP